MNLTPYLGTNFYYKWKKNALSFLNKERPKTPVVITTPRAYAQRPPPSASPSIISCVSVIGQSRTEPVNTLVFYCLHHASLCYPWTASRIFLWQAHLFPWATLAEVECNSRNTKVQTVISTWKRTYLQRPWISSFSPTLNLRGKKQTVKGLAKMAAGP